MTWEIRKESKFIQIEILEIFRTKFSEKFEEKQRVGNNRLKFCHEINDSVRLRVQKIEFINEEGTEKLKEDDFLCYKWFCNEQVSNLVVVVVVVKDYLNFQWNDRAITHTKWLSIQFHSSSL